MNHRVTKGVLETPVLRVDGKIAGVLGGTTELTWPHIQLYKASSSVAFLSSVVGDKHWQ